MHRKPVPSRIVLGLVAGTLVLPMAITVVLALAALLVAMSDSAGGLVLRYVALGCGVLWIIALVTLVLAQSLNSLSDDSPRDQGPPGRGGPIDEPDETDR
jgi:hypothetical protein